MLFRSVYSTPAGARALFELRRDHPAPDTTAVAVPTIGDGAFGTTTDTQSEDGTYVATTITVLKGPAIIYLTARTLKGADVLVQAIDVARKAAAVEPGTYHVLLPSLLNGSSLAGPNLRR